MNISKFFVAVIAALFLVSTAMVFAVQNDHQQHGGVLRTNKKLRSTPATLRNDTFTISGISAGAAFAIQYGISFSSEVNANGIIAGIPYYCAQGLVAYALTCMDSPELISLSTIVETVKIYEAEGLVDPTSNIANHYFHLWSGKADTVVDQGVMMKVAEMYQDLGATSLTTVFNYSSEHAWITNKYGNDCDYLGEPFVNNCGYDFSGEYLSRAWTYMASNGKTLSPFNSKQGAMNLQRFFAFDQTKYGASKSGNSMASTGYLYIPEQCGEVATVGSYTVLTNAKVKCHLHLNFHGCTQQATLIGTKYITETNLNEYAESNNIVILYPQTDANLMNPKACFAWWDFDGFDINYANKKGVQMTMMHEMVQNLQQNGKI